MPCAYISPESVRESLMRFELRRPLRHILRGCSAGGHRNSKLARKLALAAREALGTTMYADIENLAKLRAVRWL